MEFSNILTQLAAFFRREGYPFAAIGAFGLHAYGLTRATRDLDFVTDAAAQPALIAFMESVGYKTIHRSAGYSNHLHADQAFGRVDFVYVSGETSTRLFEATREILELGGVVIPVPRPEHLAALKIHAMKNDPERRFREMADLQFLLSLPGIDEAEIRGYFEKNGLLYLLDEIKR